MAKIFYRIDGENSPIYGEYDTDIQNLVVTDKDICIYNLKTYNLKSISPTTRKFKEYKTLEEVDLVKKMQDADSASAILIMHGRGRNVDVKCAKCKETYYVCVVKEKLKTMGLKYYKYKGNYIYPSIIRYLHKNISREICKKCGSRELELCENSKLNKKKLLEILGA